MEEMDLEKYRQIYMKPPRATYKASEASEQIALFAWIALVKPREPRLRWAFHPANGEKRDKGTAVKLSKMGVIRGVPDIWLPVPSFTRNHIGLVMELKSKSGALSPGQGEWLTHLYQAGWYTFVAYGWLEAAHALCWYLERAPGEMGLE